MVGIADDLWSPENFLGRTEDDSVIRQHRPINCRRCRRMSSCGGSCSTSFRAGSSASAALGCMPTGDEKSNWLYCRQLLQVAESENTTSSSEEVLDSSATEPEVTRCPFCGQGTLQLVARTPRPRLS